MRFDVLTLFPDLIKNVLSESVIGRALKAGCFELYTHNIRDYSEDRHKRVDDTPYGGGKGMVMAAPPVYNCFCSIPECENRHTVYMSPKGKILTQKKARELLNYDNLIVLCGHYEGIDRRVIDEIVDEEISVGDYVLTGGEIPCCILIDCIARMLPGVLANEVCFEDESIFSGMLEYPQYTRPYEYHGVKVPDVLLSGDHRKIDEWRYSQALLLTEKLRPDLL
ncbi:MAG: tRNA (guanosine(37)-N1)-methyltransferase TrmD [Clostridia bacterium]|nr:tRNA (guanosine(37)-N1)-methyltransferase TrmD [Clostridia bacterium]